MAMMTLQEFIDEVRDNIRDYLPEELQIDNIKVEEVIKNNNIVLHGLYLCKDNINICPAIYLDVYYDDYLSGCSMTKVLSKIAEARSTFHMRNNFDTSSIEDFDLIKDRLFAKLVDAENNKAYLADKVNTIMDGLAVTYYISLGNEMGIPEAENFTCSTAVTKKLADLWGKDVTDIHVCAIENIKTRMPCTFCSMSEELASLMGVDPSELDVPGYIAMYIVSNKNNINGAAAILNTDMMDEIEQKIGKFIILPSSIHECILIPESEFPDIAELESMVREVNVTEVFPEEKLSDHVFKYDSKAKEIYRADHEGQRMNEQNKNMVDEYVTAANRRHHGR